MSKQKLSTSIFIVTVSRTEEAYDKEANGY